MELWGYPGITFFQQVDELFNCYFAVDIALHYFFALIQGNFARTAAHIAKIRICHFSRTINDTTHDSNFDSFEMIGP